MLRDYIIITSDTFSKLYANDDTCRARGAFKINRGTVQQQYHIPIYLIKTSHVLIWDSLKYIIIIISDRVHNLNNKQLTLEDFTTCRISLKFTNIIFAKYIWKWLAQNNRIRIICSGFVVRRLFIIYVFLFKSEFTEFLIICAPKDHIFRYTYS